MLDSIKEVMKSIEIVVIFRNIDPSLVTRLVMRRRPILFLVYLVSVSRNRVVSDPAVVGPTASRPFLSTIYHRLALLLYGLNLCLYFCFIIKFYFLA